MRYVYPAEITPDEGGGYDATFPDVYGAHTCADTLEEAPELAEDCLIAALGVHYRSRKQIPLPGPVGPAQYGIPLQPVVAAKVALDAAMREAGVTKVGPGKMLGVTEPNVRKLCDPDHQSHIRLVDQALRALGRRSIVEDQHAQ